MAYDIASAFRLFSTIGDIHKATAAGLADGVLTFQCSVIYALRNEVADRDWNSICEQKSERCTCYL